MSAPDRLPDEAIDGLLDGSPSEEAAGTPLAAYLAQLRDDAQATTPTPSSELAAVLAEGLDPADLQAASPSSVEEAPAGMLGWRRRGRVLGRVLVTKFAALGLLGKAAAAGAAVTVAASGAGVTGVLPEPVQHEFNEIVGREAPAEHDEESATTDDVDGASAETPPETPADTSTTEPLDTDVSDDATGEDGSEPGVDGEDVADDASEGASRTPEETPADEQPTQPPADADRGDEAVDGAPSDATPSEAPPAGSREAKRAEKHDVRETADREGGEQRSDHPSEAPTTDGPRG